MGGEGGDRWLGGFQRQILPPVRALFTEQKLMGLIAKERQQDLLTLKELIEAGKLRPIIDRTYPLRGGTSGHTLPRERPRARQGRPHRLRIKGHRACEDRSWPARLLALPTVAAPCFVGRPPHDNDQRLNHAAFDVANFFDLVG